MSYTTYALSNAAATPAMLRPGGRATVTANVANSGAQVGDKVVQLYIRDVASSVGFEVVTR
jgi:beta-glucosidase